MPNQDQEGWRLEQDPSRLGGCGGRWRWGGQRWWQWWQWQLRREVWVVAGVIVPAGRVYPEKQFGGNCQSGPLNRWNGQNDVIITYCPRYWLAKFGFVPACIDTLNFSYHHSAQQLCIQGWNDMLVGGGCRYWWSYLAADTMVSDFQGAGTLKKGGNYSCQQTLPPFVDSTIFLWYSVILHLRIPTQDILNALYPKVSLCRHHFMRDFHTGQLDKSFVGGCKFLLEW